MSLIILAMGVAAVPTSTASAEPTGSPATDLARYGVDSSEKSSTSAPVETVVVTGARREELLSEAAVDTLVLTRREVELSGAEDLAELLEESPGVQVVRTFAGAEIRLQGFDPEQTLILVDGQRLNGRVNGTIDLQRIPAERIERVEVIKGPASALYGSDALGGVVNVITRPPESGLEASAHAVAGSIEDADRSVVDPSGANTADVSARVSGGSDRVRLGLTGGFHHRGAFDLDASDPATTGSELTSFNIEGHGRFQLGPQVVLDLRADVFRRESNGFDVGAPIEEVGQGTIQLPDNPFRPRQAEFDRRNETTTFSVTAAPRFELAPGHDLRLLTTYSRWTDDFVRDQLGADEGDLEQRTEDDLAQLTAQYDGTLGPQHVLTGGVELLYERLSGQRISLGSRDRGRVSGFAQYDWTVVPELRLLPGLRVDVDSQFGTVPAPKLALRWDPFEAVTFRASYGVGFRAPTVREQFLVFENPAANYVVVGNPGLEPEVSRGLNVGADLRVPVPLVDSLTFSANFYRNDVDNLIQFVPLDEDNEEDLRQLQEVSGVTPEQLAVLDAFINENIDEGVTQGVESLLRIQWIESFGTDFGYTFLDGRGRTFFPDRGFTVERELVGRSPHRITFRALLDHRPWGLSAWVRGTWMSSAPFTYIDEADESAEELAEPDDRIPAFVTFDVRVEKNLNRYLSLFAGGDNLLNAGDAQRLPLLPRGVYAGINGFY